jgi:hypothetical protein
MWERPRSSRGGDDSFFSRQTKVIILDYFWLPKIYLSAPLSRAANGYGNRWVSNHIPAFFTNGGCLAFLPNDRFGKVREMIEEEGEDGLRNNSILVRTLSVMETQTLHPLWRATELASSNIISWSASVQRDCHQKVNAVAFREYLDQTTPFFVFFNAKELPDWGSVVTYVQSILTDEHLVQPVTRRMSCRRRSSKKRYCF